MSPNLSSEPHAYLSNYLLDVSKLMPHRYTAVSPSKIRLVTVFSVLVNDTTIPPIAQIRNLVKN